MIDQDQLYRMIYSPEESWRLEKTISLNDSKKFGEAICAFANDLPEEEKPGYLLIGVNPTNTLAGMKLDESISQNLLDFSKDGRIIPAPTIFTKIFHLDEGDVCVAEVLPSSLPPVRFNGKVCVRKGPRKDYATEQEENILIEKRNRKGATYDVQPCFGSTLEDLDSQGFLLGYLPLAIDPDTLAANHRDIKLQLASLQFYSTKHQVPTHAGILMFGKNPRFFIPGATIQYVKFDGTELYDDDIAEKTFEGDFLTQLGQLKLFIRTNIVTSHLPELGMSYEYNYPAKALEELIFNALIHNDYTVNAPIKIYEFSDRIEITNNGGLYGNARNDFPNNTDYRNPVISGAAKILGFVNRFGVGILRAKKALEENGNPNPEFIADQTGKFGVKIFSK
jgi:ATP-dependent DNA helicase RecG